MFTEKNSHCLVVLISVRLIWYPLMIPFSLPGMGGLHTRRALSAVTRKVWGLVGAPDGAERGEMFVDTNCNLEIFPDNT